MAKYSNGYMGLYNTVMTRYTKLTTIGRSGGAVGANKG